MSVAEKQTIGIVYESDLGTYKVLARHGDIVELRHLRSGVTFHARLDGEGRLTEESWSAISHLTRLVYEAYGMEK